MSWAAAVGSLEGVSLDQMNAEAELLTRIDRKYVVRPEALAEIVALHAPQLRALDIAGCRAANYRSVYYDTPDLASYLAAARRRPRRFKVRTREYVDSGAGAIEVKLRSARGDTVKHRQWLDLAVARGPETPAVIAYAATFAEVADSAEWLRPMLTTTYRRTTLLGPTGRITIDDGVGAEDIRGARCDYDGWLIVETKSAGGAGLIDRELWSRGIRPQRLSKYATSLASLHPDLPANRWHRTLNRYTPSHRLVAAA